MSYYAFTRDTCRCDDRFFGYETTLNLLPLLTHSGNAAPDLISTYTAFSHDIPELAIGELVGASSYTTMLLLGIIAIMHPVHIPSKFIMRDCIFLIAALSTIAFCLYFERVTYVESVILMVLYFVYRETLYELF